MQQKFVEIVDVTSRRSFKSLLKIFEWQDDSQSIFEDTEAVSSEAADGGERRESPDGGQHRESGDGCRKRRRRRRRHNEDGFEVVVDDEAIDL